VDRGKRGAQSGPPPFLFSLSLFSSLPAVLLDFVLLTSQPDLPRMTEQIADLTSGLVRELAPDRKSSFPFLSSFFCFLRANKSAAVSHKDDDNPNFGTYAIH
jgi:hypothetical protein